MNIDLQIDHLVLDGVRMGSDGADAVRAATEAELIRLLANGDLARLSAGWANPVSDPIVDLDLAGAETPAALGRAIGGAIYGGVIR